MALLACLTCVIKTLTSSGLDGKQSRQGDLSASIGEGMMFALSASSTMVPVPMSILVGEGLLDRKWVISLSFNIGADTFSSFGAISEAGPDKTDAVHWIPWPPLVRLAGFGLGGYGSGIVVTEILGRGQVMTLSTNVGTETADKVVGAVSEADPTTTELTRFFS